VTPVRALRQLSRVAHLRTRPGERARVQLLLVPVLTRVLLRGDYGISELCSPTADGVLVLVSHDGALGASSTRAGRAARIRMASTSLAFRLRPARSWRCCSRSSPRRSRARWWAPRPTAATCCWRGDAAFTLIVLFANDVLRVTFQPWKFIALNWRRPSSRPGCRSGSCWRSAWGRGVLWGRLGATRPARCSPVLVRHTLAPRFSGATLRRMLATARRWCVAIAYGRSPRWTVTCCSARGASRTWRSTAWRSVLRAGHHGRVAFQLAYGPFAFARRARPRRVGSTRASWRLRRGGEPAAMLAGLFAPSAGRVRAARLREAAGRCVPGLCRGRAGCYYWSPSASGSRSRPAAGLVGGGARDGGRREPAARPRLGRWERDRHHARLRDVGGAGVRVAQRVHPVPFRGLRLALTFALALALTVRAAAGAGGRGGVAVKVLLAWSSRRGGVARAAAGPRRWRTRQPRATRRPDLSRKTREHVRIADSGTGRARRPRRLHRMSGLMRHRGPTTRRGAARSGGGFACLAEPTRARRLHQRAALRAGARRATRTPALHRRPAPRRLSIVDLSPRDTSRCAIRPAALDRLQRRGLQLRRAARGARGLGETFRGTSDTR